MSQHEEVKIKIYFHKIYFHFNINFLNALDEGLKRSLVDPIRTGFFVLQFGKKIKKNQLNTLKMIF